MTNDMTDEQWEIVNELRMLALGHGGPCCAKAANEIERLAKRLAEAEAALRNTLLHYKISDVHFFDD